MANDFKSVILAQLGSPPPATRAERDAIYDRVCDGFETVLAGSDATAEREGHALALGEAIAEIEAELAAGETPQAAAPEPEAPSAAPVTPAEAAAPEPQAETAAPEPQAAPSESARMPGLRTLVAVAVATFVIAGAAGWYFVSTQREPPRVQSTVVPQKEATVVSPKDLDPATTDKARSFQEAMHSGDAGTVAFLLNSGYRPTRVELRTALLQVKSTQAIQVATAAVDTDIRDIACNFTTFYDVRKPMTRASLFDAEDAYSIMKQVGQDQWKSMCATESGKWREALGQIEQQSAQYNKPDAEKKKQAEACIGRFGAKEAADRWEQANCAACPENHSSCETYCPQAPKATDADEARYFRFNRGDVSMAASMAGPNRSRAELYCNLQYLTKPTDVDLANLQRFRDLVSLFK
jgi:hypothetical protein